MEKKNINPDWVIAAQNGSKKAFAELYKCSYSCVYTTIRSMSRLDEDIVMDLLQDTYIKALEKLPRLGDPTKFLAWIKVIARNTTLDYLKKNKPVLFGERQEDEKDPITEIEEENTGNIPELALDEAETWRIYQEIIDSLPDRQRIMVSMSVFSQMTTNEIARALGTSDENVEKTVRIAKKKIREKVYEIEKRDGIRLHGITPIAFFFLLSRKIDTMTMEADAEVLPHIVSTAGGAIAKGITAKIVGGIALLCVVISGVYGIYNMTTSQQETETETAGEAEETTTLSLEDEISLAYDAFTEVYTNITTEYGEMQIKNFNYETYGEREKYIEGVFYSDLIEFEDDEIPELVIAYGTGARTDISGPQLGNPGYTIEIWTWNGEKAENIAPEGYDIFYLGGDFAGTQLCISEKNGCPYIVTREGGAPTHIKMYSWNGTDFAVRKTFDMDLSDIFPYDYRIDEQEVTEDEYNLAYNDWMKNAEFYNPYIMANEPADFNDKDMMERAEKSIAETKSRLGIADDAVELKIN